MNAAHGRPTEAEKLEWLRWLVEDSLLLSSDEKRALLDKLNELKAEQQRRLFEILLNEKRLLDRARCRTTNQSQAIPTRFESLTNSYGGHKYETTLTQTA
jgi:hypothetical protein